MLSALTLILALTGSADAVTCPMSEARFDAHLMRALTALEDRRFLDFEAERRQAEAGMDCLEEVLDSRTLVHLHLVWTGRSWLDGDEQALLAGLRGLRVVHPGFRLPPGWDEVGGRLDELFGEAQSLGPGRELRLPGRLVVDGQMAAQYIPVERATVVQIRNAVESWSSWYVLPSSPTTTWLMARQATDDQPDRALAPVPVPAE
jgi:hypothetical protein